MSKKLNVYFHDQWIGTLEQNPHGEMIFAYSMSWLQNPAAIAISCSLPLRSRTFTQKECRPFFAGILPEDNQRKLIAKNLGISANNDFRMLEKIGGECAGAITFVLEGKKLDSISSHYQEIDIQTLTDFLKKLAYQPLLAGEEGIRLSMAGVQDKIPVRIESKKISIPLNNSPSTHILKPVNASFPGLLYNEAFCLSLARKIGLIAAKAEIHGTPETEYLLIERYDRVVKNGEIKRLHQEDFCQALGVIPERKYQNEGGPSFKDCFSLIRRVSTLPVFDLEQLISAVIFNVLIGNCDSHGKNFSLLYSENEIKLAPLYDLVCTMYYSNLTTKMAMKLGNEYDVNKINLAQFETLAEQIGLTKAGICRQVSMMTEKISSIVHQMQISNHVEKDIAKIIMGRCKIFMKAKEA